MSDIVGIIDSAIEKDNQRANLGLYPHNRLDLLRASRDEIARLRGLINNPHIEEFFASVRIEQAHQKERWPNNHDADKDPEDWLWLIGYLTTKATQAARYEDQDKYLHHIITTAAACANWHQLAKPIPPLEGASDVRD